MILFIILKIIKVKIIHIPQHVFDIYIILVQSTKYKQNIIVNDDSDSIYSDGNQIDLLSNNKLKSKLNLEKVYQYTVNIIT